jgi:hypothetical protein
MKLIKLFFLGLGLSFGAGLVYIFLTNETARLIIVALVMFLLGATIVGAVVLLVNRQWANAFGARRDQYISKYPTPQPFYPQSSPPALAAGYTWPDMQLNPTSIAVSNDDPVA